MLKNVIGKLLGSANDRIIKNYDKNSIPDTYIAPSGTIKKYDWDKIYDGARMVLMWAK